MSRVTTRQIRNWRQRDRKMVMVTCYDATFARLVDQAGIDAILIGDSLGMVIQGHEHTLPCLLYTSPSPRDYAASRMPSSA